MSVGMRCEDVVKSRGISDIITKHSLQKLDITSGRSL